MKKKTLLALSAAAAGTLAMLCCRSARQKNAPEEPETQEQEELVQACGCRYVQGMRYAAPASVEGQPGENG